jgi:hypothetical protein
MSVIEDGGLGKYREGRVGYNCACVTVSPSVTVTATLVKEEHIHHVPHKDTECQAFFPSRSNWDPHPPYSQGSVAFPPFESKEEDTLACVGVGWGGDPIPTKGQTLWYSCILPCYLFGSLLYFFLSPSIFLAKVYFNI